MSGERRARRSAPDDDSSALVHDGVIGLAEALATWLPLTLLIGISPGVFAWAMAHRHQLTHLLVNELDRPAREEMLLYSLGSLVLTLAMYTTAFAMRRYRTGRFSSRTMTRLNRAFAWVIALPCFAALAVPEIEVEQPLETIVLIAIAAIACGVSAAELLPNLLDEIDERFLGEISGRVKLIVSLTLVAVMAWLYSHSMIAVHLQHHRNLYTGAFDLGVYTNVMWQSLHGRWLHCSFMDGAHPHFDPIVVLASGILSVHRGAEALIVVQVVWLASAAIPIFLVGRRVAGAGIGLVLAAAYLLSPALHGINLADFHSLSLSVPLLVWAVFFVELKAWKSYAFVFFLLLLCREDAAAHGVCLGLFILATRRSAFAGSASILISVTYFALVAAHLLPPAAASSTSFFTEMAPQESGATGVVETLLSNPTVVLGNLLRPERIQLLSVVLLPVVVLPLFCGKRWVLAGYGIVFFGLVSSEMALQLSSHYPALLVPAVFALAPMGAAALMQRWRMGRGWPATKSRAAIGAAVLVAAGLTSWAFGALTPKAEFWAEWHRVETHSTGVVRERSQLMLQTERAIGPEDTVCATGLTLAHFAARDGVYLAPLCREAEWVVARTDIIGRRAARTVNALRQDPAYRVVTDEADLLVLRRRSR